MKKLFCVLVPVCIISIVWLYSCNDGELKKFANKNIAEGFQLSKTYCGSCHQYPEPDLLDKVTWANYVLPKMGELAGFRYLGLSHYVENGNTAIMKLAHWNKIVQYYTTQSPEKLPKGEAKAPSMGLKQFNIQIPPFGVGHPSTTMVNASSSNRGFFFW